MANRRVLVKRRKAVSNIRKITRTMQLIATARFQAAFNRAVAARPYTEKLAELVSDLSRSAGDIQHPLMTPAKPDAPAALVVVTSSRGLCGGYNANLLRLAQDRLEEWRERAHELRVFGKKGIANNPRSTPSSTVASPDSRRPPAPERCMTDLPMATTGKASKADTGS